MKIVNCLFLFFSPTKWKSFRLAHCIDVQKQRERTNFAWLVERSFRRKTSVSVTKRERGFREISFVIFPAAAFVSDNGRKKSLPPRSFCFLIELSVDSIYARLRAGRQVITAKVPLSSRRMTNCEIFNDIIDAMIIIFLKVSTQQEQTIKLTDYSLGATVIPDDADEVQPTEGKGKVMRLRETIKALRLLKGATRGLYGKFLKLRRRWRALSKREVDLHDYFTLSTRRLFPFPFKKHRLEEIKRRLLVVSFSISQTNDFECAHACGCDFPSSR